MLIGSQLRSLRKAQNMTLDVLAERTAMNKGYLSRLERGLKAPSVSTLVKLSEALSVSVGELIGENISADSIYVSRATERTEKVTQDEFGRDMEMLSGNSSSLNAFIISPATEFSEHSPPSSHAGEELLMALAGTIEIRFSDRGYVLDEGDNIVFPGHLPHRVRRIGDVAAKALIVVSRAHP